MFSLPLMISFLGFSNLDRSILSITFKPGVLGYGIVVTGFFYNFGNRSIIFKSHFEINSATKPLYG
jgi:hypothetical protein